MGRKILDPERPYRIVAGRRRYLCWDCQKQVAVRGGGYCARCYGIRKGGHVPRAYTRGGAGGRGARVNAERVEQYRQRAAAGLPLFPLPASCLGTPEDTPDAD